MVDYTSKDIYTLAMENQNPYKLFPYGNVNAGFHDLTSGQGNISNVRHAVGTSLTRDYIASLLDPFHEHNKATGNAPWWGARWAGNTGAWLAGAIGEVADANRSYKEGNPKWYVQPWEDLLANTMGLKEANYYTSPDQKAKTMTKAYAHDKGIMNALLQKLSADNPYVLRQKDLQRALVPGSGSVGQVPRHVPRHSFRSIWHDPDHQKRQWQKPYDDGPTWRQVRSKENAIEGGAAGASAPSFIPKPVSFLPPSQPLPPKGAAGFNTGGIVSLWQR
tara:strand:- start:567 stop:1394 length:828 start_codon:yes stop_codon:yes gene_type:complete